MKYLQTLILSGVYCVLLLLSHTVLGEQDTSLNNRIDSLKSSVEVDTSQSLNVNADSLANNKNNIDTSTNYIISTIDDSSEQADHNILKKVKVHFTQNELVSTYFTYSSWSSRSLLFIICILYFYWLYRLNKKISIDNKDKMDKHDIGSNSIWQQALKAIILFLILLPFASLKIPVLVIQSSYLLITFLLLILLFAHITLSERKNLIAIFIFYTLLLLSNLLISTEVMPRIFAGFMNILGISLLLRLNKILISKIDENKHFKYVAWGIILTHTLALFCILFGYIDYARIWSTVAGVSLVQTIALKYLKTIFARDLELQFTSAPRLHTLNNFSLDKVLHVFYKLLKLCFVALVFITFFNILGVIGEVIVFVKNIFNNEHHIGNITYNYADLLLAIFVLWLSNWFQKNLKNVLDDSPKKVAK